MVPLNHDGSPVPSQTLCQDLAAVIHNRCIHHHGQPELLGVIRQALVSSGMITVENASICTLTLLNEKTSCSYDPSLPELARREGVADNLILEAERSSLAQCKVFTRVFTSYIRHIRDDDFADLNSCPESWTETLTETEREEINRPLISTKLPTGWDFDEARSLWLLTSSGMSLESLAPMLNQTVETLSTVCSAFSAPRKNRDLASPDLPTSWPSKAGRPVSPTITNTPGNTNTMLSCENNTTGTAPRNTTDKFAANRLKEPSLIKAWIEKSDSNALNQLITNYRPMFGNQIKRLLAGRAVSTEHRGDLEQECILAFISAVNRFDSEKNASLATYAQEKVRNALLQYSLDFRSSYRIGRSSDERKAYYAAQKLHACHAGQGDGNITERDIKDISERTGSSMKATRRAVESTQSSQTSLEVSHDNLVSGDHGEQFLLKSSRDRAMEEVRSFLSDIPSRDRDIISRSFLSDDDPSNVDLSEDFHLTPERIGQIKRRVLKGLAQHFEEVGLDMEDIL